MRALLNPRAVAVVGASQRPGRGTSILANLRDAGFKGGIYAVNPRYTDVLGSPCFASVRELPQPSTASWLRSRPTPPATCWKPGSRTASAPPW